MAQVLQNTISEVDNERNKLSTLFLHMTDGVVAFDRSGQVIHCNPAAVRMLSRGLDTTVTYDEVFGADVAFEKLLSLKRSEYLECQKRILADNLQACVVYINFAHIRLLYIHHATI